MINHADIIANRRLSAGVRRGVSTLKAEQMWNHGRIYGAVEHWSGADPELRYCRPHHSLMLTLSGGTELTEATISGSPTYDGRDGSGCVTFVPAGVEKLGRYRNADMIFVIVQFIPDFVQPWNFESEAPNLQPFTNRRDSLLESILWSLSGEMLAEGAELPSLYAEHAVGLAMAHLTRSEDRPQPCASVRGGLSTAKLRLVLEFIEEHLDLDLSLSDLGALVGMGPDVFARNFKTHMGVPPYRYLMRRRMRRAEVLLAGKDRSIAEIALAVGFSSQSHFTTHFTRHLNATPAAYRAFHQA